MLHLVCKNREKLENISSLIWADSDLVKLCNVNFEGCSNDCLSRKDINHFNFLTCVQLELSSLIYL